LSGWPLIFLVVDDVPPIRKLLRVGLTAQGYEVHEAPDAATARALAGEVGPDLIVLDLGLPDTPGHALLGEWREQGLTTPVVILSSRTDEGGIVKVDEREIKLSPKEYDILRVLAQYSGKVLTHQFMLKQIWGPAADVQYLRVYVRQLRQKIEATPDPPQYITTETGVGYRLREADLPATESASPASG
jgi:two-component system KDP operon response regulator KdpE